MTQTVNRSGFEQTNYGLYITKDVEAQLIYTFDWSEWLDTGGTVSTVDYTVAARRNDRSPIVEEDSGVSGDNLSTYIEISGGQVDKTYIVSCKVTTANGLIDKRNFQMKVVDRSA